MLDVKSPREVTVDLVDINLFKLTTGGLDLHELLPTRQPSKAVGSCDCSTVSCNIPYNVIG